MYDTTAVAWHAHMGFGSSVLLEVFGPLSFCCGRSLSIYREMRLFEISRSVLSSEPTLLAQENWLLHDEVCRTLVSDWGLLETAFDLLLRCSTLSQRSVRRRSRLRDTDPDVTFRRAIAYTNSQNHEHTSTHSLTLRDFSQKGEHLHSQLTSFACSLVESTAYDASAAWMYYHAISLYLSGIFDHTLPGILPVAQSSDHEIMVHIDGILEHSDEVLQQSQVSHIFLLLPLRIAGNRCGNTGRCREVLKRVEILQNQFAIARTVRDELLKTCPLQSL